MSETCEGCPFHKRVSAGVGWNHHEDFCYVGPGVPVKRQTSNEYWPDHPRACSQKPKEPTDA